ncbi:unnamed protein product, partial [Prorocentrum cordatum]
AAGLARRGRALSRRAATVGRPLSAEARALARAQTLQALAEALPEAASGAFGEPFGFRRRGRSPSPSIGATSASDVAGGRRQRAMLCRSESRLRVHLERAVGALWGGPAPREARAVTRAVRAECQLDVVRPKGLAMSRGKGVDDVAGSAPGALLADYFEGAFCAGEEAMRRGVALFALISLSTYLRLGQPLGVRGSGLAPPKAGATARWSLQVQLEERASRRKLGDASVSAPLGSVLAAWMGPALERLEVATGDGPLGASDCVELPKKFRRVAQAVPMPKLVPCRAWLPCSSIDAARAVRALVDIKMIWKWRSGKGFLRFEWRARLAVGHHGRPSAVQRWDAECGRRAEGRQGAIGARFAGAFAGKGGVAKAVKRRCFQARVGE